MNNSLATIGLKNRHEIYEQIKVAYLDDSEWFVYYWATCPYLDPDVNLETALKLRQYGGSIGIDNLP